MELGAIVFAFKILVPLSINQEVQGVFLPQESEVYFHLTRPQHEAVQVDQVLGGL